MNQNRLREAPALPHKCHKPALRFSQLICRIPFSVAFFSFLN